MSLSPQLETIDRLRAALKECEADRQAKWQALERFDRALRESQADRQARLEVIERLDAALRESEADRQARLEVIERLDAALRESEADRQAPLEHSRGDEPGPKSPAVARTPLAGSMSSSGLRDSQPLLQPVLHTLMREIQVADIGPDLEDNVDFLRFPEGMGDPPPGDAAVRLAELLSCAVGLQLLDDKLDEAGDRELLARVLAFRVLGHRRVRLPMTAERLRALSDTARSMRIAEGTAPFGFDDWLADDYDLTAIGVPLQVRTMDGGIVATFLVDQYSCRGAFEICVQPGDVVIDGGACDGDTSLYFAHLTGATGRVHAFEFEPGNLGLLEQNLALNPEVAKRIDVRRSALWDKDGETVRFTAFGPATAVTPSGEGSTRTESIDALVERGSIERVDFIKLDIEGSELQALRGAEATLRRFRPRLAIAAYHRPDDLAMLPVYLDELDLGYRFRLGHTTMHSEETVLFARAVTASAQPQNPV